MSTAGWARTAAICSPVSTVLFMVATVVCAAERHDPRASGPYAVPVSVLVIVAGLAAGAWLAWGYERLARGRFEGRPRWRVANTWCGVVVLGVLILTGSLLSVLAVGAWAAMLGWAVAVTAGARSDSRRAS